MKKLFSGLLTFLFSTALLAQTSKPSLFRQIAATPNQAVGDTYYTADTAGTITRLAVGASGTLLQVSGGLPSWQTNITIPGTLTVSGGNTTIQKSVSGSNLSLTLSNTSNTANSQAVIDLLVAGGSAGDPVIRWTVSGGQSYSMGIDNSASDAFVISRGTVLGTTNFMSVDTSGNITFGGGNVSLITGETLTASILSSVAGDALTVSATSPAAAASTQAGENATFSASNAVAGTSVAGAAAGGDVSISGGNAARLTSGNANGGNIKFNPGGAIGTGTMGQLQFSTNTSGQVLTFLIQNLANTSGSGALFEIVSGGTTANGPQIYFHQVSGNDFSFGINQAASNRLYLTANSSLSTGVIAVFDNAAFYTQLTQLGVVGAPASGFDTDLSSSVPSGSTGAGTNANTVLRAVGATGGATSGAGGNTAGTGGSIVLTAGAGGNASNVAGTNGTGGAITLTSGVAGSGAGVAGVAGDITLESKGFNYLNANSANVFTRHLTGTISANQSVARIGWDGATGNAGGGGSILFFMGDASANQGLFTGRLSSSWDNATVGSLAGQVSIQVRKNNADSTASTTHTTWGSDMGTTAGYTNGGNYKFTVLTESMTLTTTPQSSSANLLPAASVILGVTWRVTTGITGTAASIDIGDATTATRFASAFAKTVNGTGDTNSLTGLWNPANANAAGPVQAAAAKIQVRASGGTGTITGGVVELVVYALVLTPPTS